MIEKAKEEFDYLPIINTWEDVFDEGICKGTVNWQLIVFKIFMDQFT